MAETWLVQGCNIISAHSDPPPPYLNALRICKTQAVNSVDKINPSAPIVVRSRSGVYRASVHTSCSMQCRITTTMDAVLCRMPGWHCTACGMRNLEIGL